jgi:hypothetical protein
MPARWSLMAVALLGTALAGGGPVEGGETESKPEASPGPKPEAEPWSSPGQGVAVLLRAVNPEVSEVIDAHAGPAARIEFQLLVKNVSGAPLTLKVEPLNEALMQWSLSAADGSNWTPMYPNVKPAGGSTSRKLEPNEVFAYAPLKGPAMFAPAGQSGPACRAMLPAGTYKMAAGNVRLPGIGWAFATNPVTIRVLSADQPVDGLRLALSAEKTETVSGPDGREPVPIKLKLTFINVGDKPIKLNLFNLAWASLSPDVESAGNVPARIEGSKLPDRSPPAPKAEDYPTLEPGKTFVFEDLAFPGDCGRRHFSRTGPAGAVTCRVRMCYKPHAPAAGDKLAQGCWTGKVRSNEISFGIK